jgi:hypothetical protein
MNPQFGSGVVVITPNAGNLALNPTPTQLKVMQDASVDFKAELKKLYGQMQGALATARGKIDISGKLKVASFNANDINQVYWGQTVTAGGSRPVANESHAIASTVTPSVGTGLLVVEDLGVVNGVTGVSMTKVATSPIAGQYEFTPATTGGSPTAAVYGFAAADVTSAFAVLISYTSTSTSGSTLLLTNQFMGTAPVGQLVLFNQFEGKVMLIQLNAVTLGDMSIPTKQDDFWTSDLSFSANVDFAGNWGLIYAD